MELPPSFDDGRPPFDHALARELIGKYVLVGMTVQDKRGEVKSRTELHGRVTIADAKRGVCLALEGKRKGQEYWLPPDTRAFLEAKKGQYTLYSTDEIVADPDYLAIWTNTRPDA